MTFARLYREVFQTGLRSTHLILTGMGRAMEKNSAIRAVIGPSETLPRAKPISQLRATAMT